MTSVFTKPLSGSSEYGDLKWITELRLKIQAQQVEKGPEAEVLHTARMDPDALVSSIACPG